MCWPKMEKRRTSAEGGQQRENGASAKELITADETLIGELDTKGGDGAVKKFVGRAEGVEACDVGSSDKRVPKGRCTRH